MSRVCLLGDPHFGIKNNSQCFIDYYKDFYNNIFFPELMKRNINTLIIMGDTFDKRTHTNHVLLNNVHDILFDKLNKMGVQVYLIVGNHDTTYKNTLEPNSPRLLLHAYENITIIDKPIRNDIGLFVPWICEDNYDECISAIKNPQRYCFGHFELSGFLNNSHIMKEGLYRGLFKDFQHVYSGHYHDRQTLDNITYVGTPYEMTIADMVDRRGFHVLNTCTGDLEFIENPHKMFHKLYYTGSKSDLVPNITGKIVRVIVEKKETQKKFDEYMAKLYEQNPYEIKIQESIAEHDELEEDVDLEIDTTEDIIRKYIENTEISLNKTQLNNLFKVLHREASLL